MDSRLRGNDVVLSFHSQKASISVRSIFFKRSATAAQAGTANSYVIRAKFG